MTSPSPGEDAGKGGAWWRDDRPVSMGLRMRRLWIRATWGWYRLTRGCRNVVRWAPAVWNDEDFDWSGMAAIMETKLRRMAASAEGWMVMGANRNRRDMLIAAECLKRLREDNYYTDRLPLGQTWEDARDGQWWPKHTDAVAKADEELLWKQMRNMRGWWD